MCINKTKNKQEILIFKFKQNMQTLSNESKSYLNFVNLSVYSPQYWHKVKYDRHVNLVQLENRD